MSFQDEIQKANTDRKTIIGDNLTKGHKGGGAPIGTIKDMGGRPYIKTAQGWRYHGSGSGKKAQEHGNKVAEIQHPEIGVPTSQTDLSTFIASLSPAQQKLAGDFVNGYDYAKRQGLLLNAYSTLKDLVAKDLASRNEKLKYHIWTKLMRKDSPKDDVQPFSPMQIDDGSTTNLSRVSSQHQKNIEAYNANPNEQTLATLNDSSRFLGLPETSLPQAQPIQSPSHEYLTKERAKLQAQLAHMDSYEQWYGANAQKVQSFIDNDLAPALKAVGLTLDSAKIQEPYNEHGNYTNERRMVVDARAALHKGSLYERYQDRSSEKRAKERVAKMAEKFNQLTGHILDISHYAFDKENLGQPGHITIKVNV